MDLDFYVGVRTCKKSVTGKQPLKSDKGLLLNSSTYSLYLTNKITKAC